MNNILDNTDLSLVKQAFDKLIKPLQGVDLFDEYIQIRLKISKLSASKRNAVLQHILYQYNTDSKVKEVIDELDKSIVNELYFSKPILKK